ncbi:MAG: Ig-like domain-containing protein, partial [Verrucomicrobiota bacterium]
VDLAGSPTINGTLTLPVSPQAGLLVVGAHTLTLNGPAIAGTAANLATTLSSSLVFGGSASGINIPSSVAALGGLTLNNARGATLNHDLVIGTQLALTSGALIGGSYLVDVRNTSNSSVTRGTGWVIGMLQKAFAVGASQSFTYWVGDGTACRQIELSSMNVSEAGSARYQLIPAVQPQLATSGLNALKTLPFYWRRTAVDRLTVESQTVTDYFITADVPSGASASRFVVRGWTGTVWGNQPVAARTATSVTVNSMLPPRASDANAVAEFTAGEPLASQIVVTLPDQTFTPGTGNSGTVSAQIAGTSFNLKLSAVDPFKIIDTNYSGLVAISYSGPSTSPGGSTTVYTADVTFANGQVISVPTLLKAAETTTITASGGGLTGAASSSLTVGPGTVAAGTSTVAAAPASVAADGVTLSTTTATLLDAYGNPVAGKAVSLAKTSGAGSPTITTTQGTTDSSGVATFTVQSTTAAANGFTAKDTTDSDLAITQTATVTFTAGALDHFAISEITGSKTAGTPITGVTLRAQDANDNTVTGFAGSVTCGGTAGVTGNSGNFNSGVLSGVSFTPTVAGNSLTFTVDDGNGHTGSTTIPTVGAGALHHYQVVMIRPVYKLVAFNTVVTAQDQYGNTVTTASATVTPSSSNGGAAFTPTSVAPSSGVANFSTLFSVNAANVTITASSSTPTITGTSDPFNVVDRDGSYQSKQTGNWSDSSTWEANQSGSWQPTNSPPLGGETIFIKPGTVVTVTIATTPTVQRVHVDGILVIDSSAVFTVASGSSPSFEVHNRLENSGTLTINSGAIFDVMGSGIIYTNSNGDVVPSGGTPYPVAGLLQNAGTITKTGSLIFLANSTYQHNFTEAEGTIPTATTWGVNSTCEIIGYTSNTTTPSGLGQSFQNFVWNCPGQLGHISLGSGFTAANNFTASSTGSGSLAVVLGADLAVANATTVAAGAALYCGTYKLTGGSFTLEAGGNLGIGSTDGITAGTSFGNIQTATRSFSAGGHYVYNGSAAQATGDGLPSLVDDLTIDNSAGVTLRKR